MPETVLQGVRILGRMSGRQAELYRCAKAGGIIALESPSEKAVAQLADLDPRVASVKAQPLTVDIVSGRLYHSRQELEEGRKTREKPEIRSREYTPDLLFTLFDGITIVIEVKDRRHPGDDAYWEKVGKAETILRANGYEFTTVVLDYEPSHPIVQNAALLTSYSASSKVKLSTSQAAAATEMLQSGEQKLGALCSHLKLSLRDAPILLLSGLIRVELTKSRISAASLAHIEPGSFEHLQILPLYSEKP